ncbi:putative membrane-associated kinase regulator 6 [Cocos nucifera]|uniref:Putative membrane-associated kinase regulator 6 n=1 Tax=Cocos nucifera TaxID=13894 RepID=A0A8K0IU35_COCNU|nr:putative membrane-associated kinase regulator 6 [Cocos nucifera]
MEPLRQELTIDSFSYNWLRNIKPSIDSLDDGLRFSLDFQDAGSFIEMDPKLISMRWTADSIDFDFTLPSSQSPVLAHADHIFSNGLLLPLDHLINPPINGLAAYSSMNAGLIRSLSIDSSKSNRFGSRYLYTVPSSPISLNSSSLFSPVQVAPTSSCLSSGGSNSKLHFLGGCTKSSKKFFQRYLSFLMPLYKKFKGLKSIGRVASSTRSCMETTKSFECRHGRRTFDMGTENVIDDAILHCKNSIR